MSSDIFWNLDSAKCLLTKVEDELNNAPEKVDIADLMAAVEKIDRYYKDGFCLECDQAWGEEPGTTYEAGANMEFYLESDWWHDVSVALRKLKGSA